MRRITGVYRYQHETRHSCHVERLLLRIAASVTLLRFQNFFANKIGNLSQKISSLGEFLLQKQLDSRTGKPCMRLNPFSSLTTCAIRNIWLQ